MFLCASGFSSVPSHEMLWVLCDPECFQLFIRGHKKIKTGSEEDRLLYPNLQLIAHKRINKQNPVDNV